MAVALGSQESAGAAHRGTSSGVALTWSFNNVAGTFAVMGVVISSGGSPVITQVRYNAVDFLPIGSPLNYAAGISLQMFFLRSPATGSNTASVTATGSATFSVMAGMITFTGVEATNWPIGSPNSWTRTTSTAAAATAPLTPANGSYVVGIGSWGSGENATPDAGWSESCEVNGGGGTEGDNFIMFRRAGDGSAITPGFTWATTDNNGIVAVEILATLALGSDVQFAPYLGRS